MSKLQRALKQNQPAGIYRFDSNASVELLRSEAENAGWKIYFLDGKAIRDKKTFLEHIARAMKFPDYFGKNWDALQDCLTDLQGIEPKGYILVYQSPTRFIKSSPGHWAVARDVFNSVIEFWGGQGIPFYVLLRGTTAADIPLLS